jgi:signal transduction histidine kinase
MDHRKKHLHSPMLREQSVDVRELVEEVCSSQARRLADAGIELAIDVPHRATAWGDREMLRTAVANLVHNAGDAMPTGGELVITCHEGRYGLELEVADSGPGLDDEALTRAFEPYFTTKPNCAGLGLAVARRIAEAHGGEVLAANCPEGGAAFTLRIPRRALGAAA